MLNVSRYNKPRLGITSQKVILLLLAGISLGLSNSPRGQWRILKSLTKEWRKINRQELYRSIRRLYASKLVDYHERQDGSISMLLNENGKKAALHYKLDEISINKPANWDHKWRIVLFDVPEKKKKLREALRERLKQLGFIEFQKSVFIHPYECKNEIDFITELYNGSRFVRFIEATHLDNELDIKNKFNLI
ncbi:MAG: CRISPR-associated endonuclease Cas2 [Parcubacteria group bacterium]|nr:CRISPR-associated endonuclease Cas2 [Parcubacteria group bacterium]